MGLRHGNGCARTCNRAEEKLSRQNATGIRVKPSRERKVPIYDSVLSGSSHFSGFLVANVSLTEETNALFSLNSQGYHRGHIGISETSAFPSMEGNADGSKDDQGDRPLPNSMSATFRLDHVGEVVVTIDSDALSWKTVRAEENKRDCLGFGSNVETEIRFSDIYAADFIKWGPIHEPIIPISGAHFLSRVSMMYRFAVHAFQKSQTQNSPWVPVMYIFGHNDTQTCLMWTKRINDSLSLQAGRPKSLLVFVHPLSGKGKGPRTWESVAPIFNRAKVKTKVVVTERAGHAFDMMTSFTDSDLNSYDGVIAVGGDGFFNEILNGFLLSRHNAPYPPAPAEFMNSVSNNKNHSGQGVSNSSSSSSGVGPTLDQGEDQEPLLRSPEAIASVHKNFRVKDGSHNLDREPVLSLPHEWFRFGIIPAGSTDAIVICTTGTRDAATSALQIVLGKKRHLDIAQVVRWKTSPSSIDAPSVRYAASFVGYGFYGDVIKESERYRWMGPKRYDYAGTKVFLKHKSYEAEVAYVDVKTVNPPKAATAGGTRQWWRLPKTHDKVTCSVNCPVCDAETKSCCDSEDLKWLQCKGRFLSVGAAVISCRNERAPDGLVADAHLADGFMHLILVKDCPHPLFLWHLTQLARKGGRPLNLDFVEHHKTTAFTFTTSNDESTWNLDGELFPACQLSAQVFRGLISMFASGPDV